MNRAAQRARGPKRRNEKTGDARRIVQGLRRIVKALETFSHDVRSMYGVTAPQLWALKTLHAQPRLTTGELAAALVVDQSSVSILVKRLAERGLLRRIRGRPDRRFVHLELTQRGRALAARAPEAAQGSLLHAIHAMTPGEVRAIRRAVERLVGAMEASGVEARFFFEE